MYQRSITNAVLWLATQLTICLVVDGEQRDSVLLLTKMAAALWFQGVCEEDLDRFFKN